VPVDEIVRYYGPDHGFLRMDTLRQTYRSGAFTLYQITPNQDVVDRTFSTTPTTK
jgi:hypothetical protein